MSVNKQNLGAVKLREFMKQYPKSDSGYMQTFVLGYSAAQDETEISCIEARIEENQSILQMAKLHMDERATFVLESRITLLIVELNKKLSKLGLPIYPDKKSAKIGKLFLPRTNKIFPQIGQLAQNSVQCYNIPFNEEDRKHLDNELIVPFLGLEGIRFIEKGDTIFDMETNEFFIVLTKFETGLNVKYINSIESDKTKPEKWVRNDDAVKVVAFLDEFEYKNKSLLRLVVEKKIVEGDFIAVVIENLDDHTKSPTIIEHEIIPIAPKSTYRIVYRPSKNESFQFATPQYTLNTKLKAYLLAKLEYKAQKDKKWGIIDTSTMFSSSKISDSDLILEVSNLTLFGMMVDFIINNNILSVSL